MDDDEIFPIGKLLRRYKLDELPQIFNILIGDMSLIGPRPCLESTIESMPNWALKRFEIKPGITGLAQINGFRGETKDMLLMEHRIKYDLTTFFTT